jgi:hypothetical protein
MITLEEVIRALPPELQQEIEAFARFLLERRTQKYGRKLRQDWAGALREYSDQYTSVELQHKISDLRIEDLGEMKMNPVYKIYESQVKPLSVTDRLQLARLIMDDLAESAPNWVVESSNVWSQEDLDDVSRSSLSYASQDLSDKADEDAESC